MNLSGAEASRHNLSKMTAIARSQELNVKRRCFAKALDTPVFLPGESPGPRSLLGCHLWGRTELDMTDVT